MDVEGLPSRFVIAAIANSRLSPGPSTATTDDVSFDPYEPYGRVIDTTMRVVTWNVWGCYGDWQARETDLERTLSAVRPDVVCLVESWSRTETTQVDRVAAALGFEHAIFHGGWTEDAWTSGIAVASSWPIARHEVRALPATATRSDLPCSLRSRDRADCFSSSSRCSTIRSTRAHGGRHKYDSSPSSSLRRRADDM